MKLKDMFGDNIFRDDITVKKVEWISVSKSKPSGLDEVLLYNSKSKGACIGCYFKEIDCFYHLAEENKLPIEVTHWFPLPMEPKDE